MGETQSLLARPGGQRKDAVSPTRARRFLKWRSYEGICAIAAKVLVFTADHWLTAAGVAAAAGSAAFAGLMITQNSRPDLTKKAEYRGSFARDLRAPPHPSQVFDKKPDGPPARNRTIDYNVTGSIIPRESGKPAQNGALASDTGGGAATKGIRANNIYVLRFVHKETALLQSKNGFYVVRRGTVLPGAGKVLSLEKLGNTWFLVTEALILRIT